MSFSDKDCSCPMNCQLHQPIQSLKFTDENLKQLKTRIFMNDRWTLSFEEMSALLARLEAAEALLDCIIHPTGAWTPETQRLVDAWRKASGKEGK